MTSEKFQRQSIWESSRRPLYPKCVWVEANGTKSTGYRHIIFDHDIAKRRPTNVFLVTAMAARATSSWPMGYMEMHAKLQPQRARSYGIGSDDDVESLKLIGNADITSYSGGSDESPKKLLFDGNGKKMINNSVTVCSGSDNVGRVNVRATSGKIDSAAKHAHRKSIACATASGIDCNEPNQLTERVLQWLDLAGGTAIDRNDFDDIDEKRQSLLLSGANERIRAMTVTGAHERKNSTQSVTMPVSRRESIHHLSLIFNEDNNNVMQKYSLDASESSSSIPLNERVSIRFGGFFPTTYRCSRKFLSLRTGKAASFDNGNGSARTVNTPNGQKSINGSATKANKVKFQKVDQIENQYRSMIQRQILETSCNQQLAKRQLHIFMPNLPKKSSSHLLATSSSAATGDECASCLSTVLSSGISKQT